MTKKNYYRDDAEFLSYPYGVGWGFYENVHIENRFRGRYRHKYSCWWNGRHVRTFNELRQLTNDDAEGLPVRRKRLGIPDWYDDPKLSRCNGRSWKDYTKQRKQWDKR